MLEDRHWMRDFMLKKTNLMAENYTIATSFSRQRGRYPLLRDECGPVYLDRSPLFTPI
ncbi:uncharacterized protein ASPGLDRAFT_37708 [Aspergillus glaucus CBS 516.65]|uniref:Uncharacterized protein n=1 Tax=Aspergillus glaucus CBS 516.65 TaxID=1160497 RepID=A0A1L9VD76_ASPGL|nr:hypothetical protein ASPGLDRAFT_37708 [Aspergillus glaucus CBS 516.65]OJJ81897.1 hypothetical protein ASPGLDRAFT_37708 [Aspergillus glaucus CBS 516.65]